MKVLEIPSKTLSVWRSLWSYEEGIVSAAWLSFPVSLRSVCRCFNEFIMPYFQVSLLKPDQDEHIRADNLFVNVFQYNLITSLCTLGLTFTRPNNKTLNYSTTTLPG